MPRYTIPLLSVLTVGLFALVPLDADTSARQGALVDDVFLDGLNYRLVGPSRGGRVTAVTGVPSQPSTFYMGVASGGVFRTTNNGASWAPITDGKVPLGSIGSIAVADSDPNIMYIGTGSDGVRSNVSTGRGVYKTTDGGREWTFAGLYDAGQIGAIRVHPTNPDIVWVSATGDMFKGNDERGVFKTTDGGATWTKALYVSDQVGAMDIELQPGNPDVVYAWMSRLERKPWTIISGSMEGGFYKSTDGGKTFREVTDGLPSELIGKANLAVTAAKPDRIYALVEAKPGGGFYRSDDEGESWTQVSANPQMIQRPFYYTTLGADPTDADTVYGGAEGFFKSTDGGVTFARMSTPHGDNHDIWVNPNDGNIMVQANDGGANVSTDGGQTWSTQSNQVTSELYGVRVDNNFPYNLYAAQQDNSTFYLSSRSDPYDTGAMNGGPGCETGPIIPHPSNPDVIYGSCKGQYSVRNLKTGQSKNYWVGGQSLYGNAGEDLINRMQRVSPMALSPHDPEVLYYGSQYLNRTRDMGVTWERISPDLTAFPECCQGPSGEPITRDVTGEEFYSTLYAITESPHQAGVIWTGANDGPYHVTRDNGETWTNVTPPDLPEGGRVAWIEASPHRVGSAYYATYRYLLGDYHPYIYLTNDYGQTWRLLTDGTNGIPVDTPTRAIREDPDREGLLYAGTEFGMYLSFDNGEHWRPFALNMPQVPINDIRVHQKDLIVATQGRALWILDDITVLHQVTSSTSTSVVHLAQPRDGYRTRVSPETLGPTFNYFLPSEPPGAVTIDILDAEGEVVNSYSSDPGGGAGAGRFGRGRGGRGGGGRGGRGRGGRGGGAPQNIDPAMMAGRPPTGGFARQMAVVTKQQGLNRFVWDGRHSNNLTPAPGEYQMRLSVAGQNYTVPFTFLIDPHVAGDGITAADLQEQFDHNVRMQGMVAGVQELVGQVQQARIQLQDATGADAEKARQVEAVAEQLLTPSIRYSKPGLQTHISYLAGMTTRADQKVGGDALKRADVLQGELDALRAAFARAMGR